MIEKLLFFAKIQCGYAVQRGVELVECHFAHTASDAVMILRMEGIVFMGDVLFVNRHPWLGDGDPDSLKKHLQRFYGNELLKQFIPGHGNVAGRESLGVLIQHITDRQKMALDAIANGEADSLFVRKPISSQYKSWWFGRFYRDNLATVYEKAKDKKWAHLYYLSVMHWNLFRF